MPEPAESRRLADQSNVDRGCIGISNGQANDSTKSQIRTKDQPGIQPMALEKGQKHAISIGPCYPKTKRVIWNQCRHLLACASSEAKSVMVMLAQWTGACIE